MIERYSRPQMAHLWSEEAKYRTWLDIEVLWCEALAKEGRVSKEDFTAIKTKADFTTEAILEREKLTKHDVAAFVSVVQESIGPAGKHLHFGLTSSDVLDTAFSYRLQKSADLLLKELDLLIALTLDRAKRDKNVLMIGRTHGIHAEPMTMGLKWLYWHVLLKRNRKRLETAREEISVGKFSGAVGTYAHLPPSLEKFVCDRLGLRVDTLSTQVIARDRYALYFSSIALIGSAVELIATELRHLQRTEVGEVQEGFTAGQKGSSAMPHKKNPISAENLTGLARLLRSYVVPALEDCALWHERDISHSSVERVIAPDANILCDYMLARLNALLTQLQVSAERMKENMDSLQGVIYSQRALLALIDKGLTRDEAYEIIQRNAHLALQKKTSLLGCLKADPKVAKVLDHDSLSMVFQPQNYLTHLDYLFEKVTKNEY